MLVAGGMSAERAALLCGLSSVEAMGRKPNGKQNYLPSPEEIAQAAAEVRASWTSSEFRRREGTVPDGFVGWRPPVVSVDEIGMDD